MSAEIALIAGSSAAGIISAAVIERLSQVKSDKRAPKPKGVPVNAAKSELASLLFEKTLCAEAITRIYETAQQGKIDRLERDRLLLKYKQQLESINRKTSELQAVTDFADLSELRNNLVSIIENRISSIDSKLLEMSRRGVSASTIDNQVKKIVEDIGNAREGAPVRIEKTETVSAEERSIEDLQKEILQALERLEQVEVDKD